MGEKTKPFHIVLVGGQGFIGSRLTKRILESGNASLTIIDKAAPLEDAAFACIQCDIRDVDSLKAAMPKADVIINLAAEHKDNIQPLSLYDEVNVQGARNVCLAAEAAGIKKIVFTSSVAVYGFAPLDTDESGEIAYFNDYGRTKWLAEEVYREWLNKSSDNSLVIIRPTVVFGEQNRGNVYNLLKQIVDGPFLMIGKGENFKSMAYVENVAAFLEYAADKLNGYSLYNYIDKPDFTMNQLVAVVRDYMGAKGGRELRLPYWFGLLGGSVLDIVAKLLRTTFPVSAIRVKKFVKDTKFATSVSESGFKPPVAIAEGIERTLTYEFIERKTGKLYFSE